MADPLALLPGADVLPIAADRIGGSVEVAVVGGDHPPLGAVDEHRQSSPPLLDPRAHRPDQVGREDAPFVADHLRVDRVIDERGNRFAVERDRLNDPHPPVVEIGGVIVEGDPPFRFGGGHVQSRRTEGVEGFVDRLGCFPDDIIHPFEVAGVSPRLIGEGIAIGGAVGVSGGDENMLRRQTGHERPHPVGEHAREAECVKADDRHGRVGIGQNKRPRGELAPLLRGRVCRSHSTRHRQERIGGDDAGGGPGPEPGGRWPRLGSPGKAPGRNRPNHQEQGEDRGATHASELCGKVGGGYFAVAGSSPS